MLYTIPLNQPYLKTLAQGINNRFDSNLTVLLPSNRAVLNLQKAFLRLNKSMALPKILTFSQYCEVEDTDLPKLEQVSFILKLLKKEYPTLGMNHLCNLTSNLTSLWDEFILSGLSLDFDETDTLFKKLTLAYKVSGIGLSKQKLYTALLTKEPKGPILLAGTTGTIPAVHELAKKILELPDGHVVLPGYEGGEYPITHPLYTQQQFAKALQQEIIPWETISDQIISSPPTLIQAKSNLHEALTIAAIVKHHLELDQKDIAIVCSDPKLSCLIQDALIRFGFEANSSLKESIKITPAFKFLNLTLNFLEDPCLKTLVSLLKHPLSKYVDQDLNFEVDDHKSYQKLFNQCIQSIPAKNFQDLNNFLNTLSNNHIFTQPDGKQLELFLTSIKQHYDSSFAFSDYIREMFSFAEASESTENLHQKVVLLGTLEARHIEAPIVILSGLNEGSWPPTLKPNIWISDQERYSFALHPQERKLGLSAHDFASCLTAETVYLTRSLKIDGAPTETSRFLRRLKNIKEDRWFLEIAEELMTRRQIFQVQESQLISYSKPEKLSISALELLNKNPYLFFIHYILKIRPRFPWFLGLSTRDIGNLVHKSLETGEEINFDTFNLPNAKKIFLQAHTKSILDFVNAHTNTKEVLHKEHRFLFDYKGIKIEGIADRLDIKKSGDVHLIDYKTGTPPSKSMIDKGLSLQMSLLAHMAESEFDDVKLEYWALKGYGKGSEIISVSSNPKALGIMETLIQYYILDGNPLLETDHNYEQSGIHPFLRG